MSDPATRKTWATVAVVSWNTRELLRRCLTALEPDASGGLVEVIVVDNDSDDGSAEMAERDFGWATTLRSGENAGFGRAVNRAGSAGSGAWLIAANADVAPEPGAIAGLLEAGGRDPGIGAVAPRLITPSGETQHSVHRFPGVALTLAFGLGLARAVPGLGKRLCFEGYWDPEERRRIDWAHGAFLAIRRSAFDQVGGFDPRQWMYAEDLDFCWRLRKAGWAIAYEPSAPVLHEVSAAASKAFGATQLDRHLEASYLWMRRWRGGAYAGAFAVANLLTASARGLLYAIASSFSERRRRHRDLMREYARAHLAAWRSSRAGDREPE